MKKNRSGALLLTELLLTILIFSLSAAVCVSLLGRAHQLDRQAELCSGAVRCVTNACEAVSAANCREEALALLQQL